MLLSFYVRIFVVACCATSMIPMCLAKELPKNHPKIVPGKSQKRAVEWNAAVSQPGIRPVPRRGYIDEFIFGKMQKDGVPHAGLATDLEFARRVHLDLTGRLPEPEVLRKFLQDPHLNKRDKLIDELMATP